MIINFFSLCQIVKILKGSPIISYSKLCHLVKQYVNSLFEICNNHYDRNQSYNHSWKPQCMLRHYIWTEHSLVKKNSLQIKKQIKEVFQHNYNVLVRKGNYIKVVKISQTVQKQYVNIQEDSDGESWTKVFTTLTVCNVSNGLSVFYN